MKRRLLGCLSRLIVALAGLGLPALPASASLPRLSICRLDGCERSSRTIAAESPARPLQGRLTEAEGGGSCPPAAPRAGHDLLSRALELPDLRLVRAPLLVSVEAAPGPHPPGPAAAARAPPVLRAL